MFVYLDFFFFRNGDSIWERLDKNFANNEWLICFGGLSVHHLNCSTFDHSPLWIQLEILDPTIQEKPFHLKKCGLLRRDARTWLRLSGTSID